MIQLRNKFLFTGPTGAGKTAAMFDIAKHALRSGRSVYYLAFDDGYMRYLPEVEEYLVHHSDEELTTDGGKGTFHVWDCVDWPSTRKAYAEAKAYWEKRDWIFFDRADIAWDFIQEYCAAVAEGVSVDKLDELFFERRMEKIEGRGQAAVTAIKQNPSGEAEQDWVTIKSNFKGVFYDACCGTDSRMLGINVGISELASLGIRHFSKTETSEQKGDSRRLYGYNITIQGEKNVPSWLETTVVFLKGTVGYTIGTDKDRMRKPFNNELLDKDEGFWKAYNRLVGLDLTV